MAALRAAEWVSQRVGSKGPQRVGLKAAQRVA